MGFSKKHEGGKELDGKKWVIAGIAIRAPLKPISTKLPAAAAAKEEREEDSDEYSTTPTARGSRIPEKLRCPPAPRKRRPAASTCHYNKEFFIPPDLESVFVRRVVERAN